MNELEKLKPTLEFNNESKSLSIVFDQENLLRLVNFNSDLSMKWGVHTQVCLMKFFLEKSIATINKGRMDLNYDLMAKLFENLGSNPGGEKDKDNDV